MDLKTLHASKSIKKRPARKRVGRGPGSKMGKTSTRGQKGAKSRTGHHRRDFYEGGQTPLMRRLPKRGFSNDPFAQEFAVINVEDLNVFDDGAEVTPALLEERGIVKKQLDGVKILGDGELAKRLTVKAHRFSKSASEKIQAKGGQAITLLAPKPSAEKKKRQAEARLKAKSAPKAKPAEGKADAKAAEAKPAEGKPAAEKKQKPQ